MIKSLVTYLKIVLVAPGILGLLSLGFVDSVAAIHVFFVAIAFSALILGPFLVGSVIGPLPITFARKITVTLIISIVVSVLVTFIYYYLQPVDAEQLVSVGWGKNRETYEEYPIKVYQLFSFGVFFLYGLVSTLQLLLYRE